MNEQTAKVKMKEDQIIKSKNCLESTETAFLYQKPEIVEISYASVVYGTSCPHKDIGGGEEECDPDLFTEY